MTSGVLASWHPRGSATWRWVLTFAPAWRAPEWNQRRGFGWGRQQHPANGSAWLELPFLGGFTLAWQPPCWLHPEER